MTYAAPIKHATALSLVSVLSVGAFLVVATTAKAAKDTAPVSATCDRYDQKSSARETCLAAHAISGDDDQLYYAGYWLAKNGRYNEALAVLAKVHKTTAAVLTYRGFSTRKLGDPKAALALYEEALSLEPENVVTRAYMGEAFLALDQFAKARAELDRIASICGVSCEAYRELQQAIAKH